MTRKAILILATESRWRIGMTDGQTSHLETVKLPENTTPEDIAQAIVHHLSQSEDSDTPQGKEVALNGVVLGTPSGWCLCGTVPVADLPPRQRRTAMLFALEEKLPMPVEQVVADFIVDGDTALGIAVEISHLQTLIDALEDRGLPVDTVCPTALLGLQHLIVSADSPEPAILWKDQDGLNLFELSLEQSPKAWRWLPTTGDVEVENNPVSASDLNDAQRRWVDRCLGRDDVRSHVIEENLAEAALQTATEIQAGRTEPFINLRRDALDVSDRLRKVRGHVFVAMVSAAALLLALTGVFMWRANAYQKTDQRYDAAVTALYHDTFGDQPRPTSVRRRLNTRLRELKGLAGQQFDDVESTEKISALWLLHDLLERIPTDQRLCVLDISIEHDYLTIAGQVRSHSDADLIAAALRRGGRFEVDPPSTTNLKDGGVSFTLRCRPIEGAPAKPSPTPTDTEPTSRVVATGGTSGGGGVLP